MPSSVTIRFLESAATKVSAIYSFPDGKLLAHVPFSLLDFEPVTSGNYVTSHDIKDFAVGLVDVSAESSSLNPKRPPWTSGTTGMLSRNIRRQCPRCTSSTPNVADKNRHAAPQPPGGESPRLRLLQTAASSPSPPAPVAPLGPRLGQADPAVSATSTPPSLRPITPSIWSSQN